MRKHDHEIMKSYFGTELVATRNTSGMTQSQMAELLKMGNRSYIDLDHGKTYCGVITIMLFLLYVCVSLLDFLEELCEVLKLEHQQGNTLLG